ncbi:MAG: alpha/beta hydrolase [Planctomycetota bacterium]
MKSLQEDNESLSKFRFFLAIACLALTVACSATRSSERSQTNQTESQAWNRKNHLESGSRPSLPETLRDWPPVGRYTFERDSLPDLRVFFTVPKGSDSRTPILIVVPGALRNAKSYRDEWRHLSEANRFITLVLEGTREDYPTEYEYNAGGVLTPEGELTDPKNWLFHAIEPLFDDFKARYGSERKRYSLYGHSAGGGFVHRFMLFVPQARVDSAVAANPAFFTIPSTPKDSQPAPYPFGCHGAGLPQGAIALWFNRPLTILLGERDTGPRTKPLSNGPLARAQGPSVYARGLQFYRSALAVAAEQDLALRWQLNVVPFVGHSNVHMASHAVPLLFTE